MVCCGLNVNNARAAPTGAAGCYAVRSSVFRPVCSDSVSSSRSPCLQSATKSQPSAMRSTEPLFSRLPHFLARQTMLISSTIELCIRSASRKFGRSAIAAWASGEAIAWSNAFSLSNHSSANPSYACLRPSVDAAQSSHTSRKGGAGMALTERDCARSRGGLALRKMTSGVGNQRRSIDPSGDGSIALLGRWLFSAQLKDRRFILLTESDDVLVTAPQ